MRILVTGAANLSLARAIATILGRELRYEIINFHQSRPGHDLRYALDGMRLKLMGWEQPVGFEASLERTIQWMIDPENKRWML